MSGGELGLPSGAAGRSPAGRGELLPALGLNLGLILLVLLLRWLWARRRPAPRWPLALPGRAPAPLPVGLSRRVEPLVPLLTLLCADRRALVLGGPAGEGLAGGWPTGAALHLSDPVLLSEVQTALRLLDAGGPPVPVVLVGPVLRLEGPMSPQ